MDTKEVVLDSENPVEITQEIQEELLNNLGKESAFETDPTLMLHIFPMQYVIDDAKVVVNPLELEAKKLAVEAFTATVSASRFNTMNQLILEFLPAVDSEFVVPSLAAGYVTTTEAERERGVFVLDFGHSFVNVLGFVNSIPVFHETVPIGFRYVIKDVSRVLNTSISEAERIITSKGFASMNPPDPSEIVEFLNVDTDGDLTPFITELFGNYPNPFNPSTTISFQLNTENTEYTEIAIYNVKGQKIKRLINEQLPIGNHSTVWNGKDDNGKQVSSGIYLYNLIVDKKVVARSKMLLIK